MKIYNHPFSYLRQLPGELLTKSNIVIIGKYTIYLYCSRNIKPSLSLLFSKEALHKSTNQRRLSYTEIKSEKSNQLRINLFSTCGLKTDHSLITVNAALHSNQRGPGYWKLNTSFLSDDIYVNQIRTTISHRRVC